MIQSECTGVWCQIAEGLKSLLRQGDAGPSACLSLLDPSPSLGPSQLYRDPQPPHSSHTVKEVSESKVSPKTEGTAWVQASWMPRPHLGGCFLFPSSADPHCSPCWWLGFARSPNLLRPFRSSPERWPAVHVQRLVLQSDTGMEIWLPIQRPAAHVRTGDLDLSFQRYRGRDRASCLNLPRAGMTGVH